ncbi:ABC transporter substrate-binding protein [Roseomonas sp. PWR1]|uniref:ABC transporter substrate-binding protein n=1 Tax=Roseomonas nitratireducens TaxID=2820810 RepID=A0ABS4AXC0_9PROT|nr:ABC transporter substrate-binding protein [Neoroseomonas nitratireducens]MBP0465401.1 ABC transporter substrate-binding protein [Neoroseomonas nitratireducens]
MTLLTRRAALAAGAAMLAAPSLARAQGAPIRLGTLTPLTGAGGPYGPVMANCVRAVIAEVNGAGGVLGRQLQLVSEDDQTNPEAGVRAARKLIDVDRVAAIMGTWASSVTTAVAPLCWESRTFLATVSGADSITALPHNGWLVRTQPNTTLQGRKFGEYALELGARRAFFMAPQTPFTQSQFTNMKAALERGGGAAELLVYDANKPSLRTEVDQALRFRPDIIVMGGYTPDTTVLLRDIFRAGYTGRKLAFAYSVNQQMLSALPNEVTEGIHTLAPSPAEDSGGYARVRRIVGNDNPDPYTCQIYDHVNLVVMAMAAGRDGTGQAIRDSIRRVSQGGGDRVDNAVDGLRIVAAGGKVDYDGASGPCDFTDAGDISDCRFRYEQVRAGRQTLLRIA